MGKEAIVLTEHEAKELQKFNVTDAAIEGMRQTMMNLTIAGVGDKVGFAKVHESRMVVKAKRIEVEKVRKKLKEDSLRYGRLVDGEAKRITELLQPIEDHLEAQETKIEEEKARLKKEEEDRKTKIANDRVNALFPYLKEPANMFAIAAMTEEEFDAELARVKQVHREEKEKREAEEAEERKRKEIAEARAKKIAERVKALAQYGVKASEEFADAVAEQDYQNMLTEARLVFEKNEKEKAEEEQRKKDAQAAEEKRQKDEKERLAREAEDLRKREAAIKEKEETLKRQEEEAAQKKKDDAWKLALARGEVIAQFSDHVDVEGLVDITEENFQVILKTAKTDWEKAQEDRRKREEEEKREKEEEDARVLKEAQEREKMLHPDRAKMIDFASAIERLPAPIMETEEGTRIMDRAMDLVIEGCKILRGREEE